MSTSFVLLLLFVSRDLCQSTQSAAWLNLSTAWG